VKNKINFITHIYLIITAIYIFFSHFKFFSVVNVNTVYLMFSLLFLGYKIVAGFRTLSIKKYDFLLFLFVVYLAISNYYFSFTPSGLEYFMFFGVISFVSLLLKNEGNWNKNFIKMIYFGCFCHCVFVLVQALLPSVFSTIANLLLSNTLLASINFAQGNNYYSGITLGPASAGLFATILIGIILCKFIVSKKYNPKNIIGLIIAILALILSQKRSFILAVVIAAVVIIYVNEKAKKSTLKFVGKMFGFAIALLVLYMALSFIPQTQKVIDRFVNNDRMLSGREVLYEEMFKWYNSNKLFGVGLGTAKATFGYGGHNIYIQLLAECGIVGIVIYVLYLLKLGFYNYKIALKRIDYKILFSIFIFIVLIIYGLTGNPIYDYSYLVFFMYALSIPLSIDCEVKNEKS